MLSTEPRRRSARWSTGDRPAVDDAPAGGRTTDGLRLDIGVISVQLSSRVPGLLDEQRALYAGYPFDASGNPMVEVHVASEACR